MPDSGRNAKTEFEAAHIPGAVFVDLDELADTSSSLPNMLPSPEKFASRMQALGLGDGSRIVVYDNSPLHTSARMWWMLDVFGAHDVAILDGGFAKWQAEGRAIQIWATLAPVIPPPPLHDIRGAATGALDGADDREPPHARRTGRRCARRRGVSPAPSPNRAPASARAISPDRATCR